MIPLRISNATTKMTGSTEDVRPLFVREVDGCFVSRWEPTPEELDILSVGGSVEVWVQGGQPPIYIGVAPLEEGIEE